MGTVDDGLRAWILANLGRGCTPDSMVEAMVEAGHARSFARTAVPVVLAEHALAQRRGPEALVAAPARLVVPEPLADPAACFVDTSDRRIRVVMTSQRPRVIVFGDVLSTEECDALVRLSEAKLERSRIVDPSTGVESEHAERTSDGTWFLLEENPLVATIDRRLSELMRWPLENGEGLQILHYTVGGEYKPHFDYFDPGEPGSTPHVNKGGNRVATLVIYLCDVEAGGATIFPDAGLSVSPVKGNAVFFSYDTPSPSSLTLHGGAPVVRGEKWIATRWVRERAYKDGDGHG